MKVLIYYNSQEQCESLREFIQLRKLVLQKIFSDEHGGNTLIEKRIFRYILESDDLGVQSSLYLLLILSDDEVKGYEKSYDQ